MAKRYYGSEARSAEQGDGGMLHNDESAQACLPQNPVMRNYSNVGVGHMYADISDTLTAIDKQIANDGSEFSKGIKPRKA